MRKKKEKKEKGSSPLFEYMYVYVCASLGSFG